MTVAPPLIPASLAEASSQAARLGYFAPRMAVPMDGLMRRFAPKADRG